MVGYDVQLWHQLRAAGAGLECSCPRRQVVVPDAAACVKSTCFNMTKIGYTVHVLSDCITSYDKKKLPEMLAYYESKGCTVMTLSEIMET